MADVITFENDIANEDRRDGAALFDEDDPFDLPPPLPPLSPQRNGEINQDGDPTAALPGSKEPDKKRKIKRSPQPRLDAARLCSDRGLPSLLHLCDDIKFKGKGHEASDLKLLLQRYEHWAHRLFPKFPFMDVVDQVENLGGKKLVQNCMKRIRRGEQDNVTDDPNSDTEITQESQDITPPSEMAATPDFNTIPSFGGQVEPPNRVVILTPEQQERIRLNKERALARRKAAMEKAAETERSQRDTSTEDGAGSSNTDAVISHQTATSNSAVSGDTEMELDVTHENEHVLNDDRRREVTSICDEKQITDEPSTSMVSNNEVENGRDTDMSTGL